MKKIVIIMAMVLSIITLSGCYNSENIVEEVKGSYNIWVSVNCKGNFIEYGRKIAYAVEAMSVTGDWDDVIYEWDEKHPIYITEDYEELLIKNDYDRCYSLIDNFKARKTHAVETWN